MDMPSNLHLDIIMSSLAFKIQKGPGFNAIIQQERKSGLYMYIFVCIIHIHVVFLCGHN